MYVIYPFKRFLTKYDGLNFILGLFVSFNSCIVIDFSYSARCDVFKEPKELIFTFLLFFIRLQGKNELTTF